MNEKYDKKSGLLLSAVLLGILSSECNDDNNVIRSTIPIEHERAVITAENVDAILATSVSGVEKIASLVDGLVEQLPTIGPRNRALSDIDITTRDCAEGG